MKVKEIKSRLNDELSAKTPDVLDKVRRTSDINVAPTETVKRAPSIKRWAPALIASCLVLVIAIGSVVLISAGRNRGATTPVYAHYVCIDINPSVEFVTDEDGGVVSVKAANEDGEILLKNLDGIEVGTSIADAVKQVLNSAAELGYIDVTADASAPNAVRITAYDDGTQKGEVESISGLARAAVSEYCKNNNIMAVFATDELTKEELFARVAEYNANVTLADKNESLIGALANRKEYYKQDVERLTDGSAEGIIVQTLYKINELKDFVEELQRQKALLTEVYDLNESVQSAYRTSGFSLMAETEFSNENRRAAATEFRTALTRCNAHFDNGINSFTLNLYYNAYASVDIDALYSVLLTIESKLYEAKETVAAISDRINAYVTTLSAAYASWSDELSSLFTDAPSTVAEYETYFIARADEKAVELKAFYAAKYSAGRTAVSDEDYAAMERAVIDTYGSFEEYFEYKKAQKNS